MNIASQQFVVALVYGQPSDLVAWNTCPNQSASYYVDMVGVSNGGSGGAPCFETQRAGSISNTSAFSIQRIVGGQDTTNNNAADFTNTSTPTPSNSAESVMPVKLTSFTGAANGTNFNLEWSSAAEINFNRYQLERSVNGGAFTQ